MKNKKLSLTILATALSLALVPATAGVFSYGTLTDWQTAGTQTGTVTFEGLTIPGSSTAFTTSGLTFSTGDPLHFLSLYNNGFGPGSGNFLVNASPTFINTNGTVFGLALNFRCYSCDPQTATMSVTDSSGVTNFIATTSGLSNFIGFRSTLAIQMLQIAFSGSQPFVALDNISFGPASDTPEAATLILIGSGLGLIARYRRYACFPTTA